MKATLHEVSRVPHFLRKRQMANWLQVSGKVVSSANNGVDDFYIAQVEFEYAVDGVAYTNDARALDREACRQLVDRYPQGSSVIVFYNQNAPNISVLEHSIEIDDYESLGVGVIFTVVGAFSAVIGFLGLRRNKNTVPANCAAETVLSGTE